MRSRGTYVACRQLTPAIGRLAAGPRRHGGAVGDAQRADGPRAEHHEQGVRVPELVRHVRLPVGGRPDGVHAPVPALQPRAYGGGDRGERGRRRARVPADPRAVQRPGENSQSSAQQSGNRHRGG